ncbi:class I SAM-dependent methyltransferase [Sinomonas terrae]|uniref:Class I SAM-dependent methyltransferase n=1 Tax=Sinomonas terrae TaxID=2908838 RepID=A0ABS9TWX4_9MICC|nr:class I SAM-dependent methyltransferase [Sinomonas terrae]MCH6468717.1 class I SAM-dependent methyltransferase [Sinomonas terrae]
MDSCCGPRVPGRDPRGYDAIFDARFSKAVARRYGRKGLGPVEQGMVDFLASAGIEGASVLEIGGGVGEIQLELLRRGAARATNLELSAGYEDDARRLAAAAGLEGRVQRRLGVDIAEAPDDVEPADVVVLHRVVCCYPDYARLLGTAADHARRALVFSYPTANPVSRLFIRSMNAMLNASGRSFRGYVHPPEAMVDVVRSRGLVPRYRKDRPVWHLVGATRD